MTMFDLIVVGIVVPLVAGTGVVVVKKSATWLWRKIREDIKSIVGDIVGEHVSPMAEELAKVKSDVAAVKAELSFNGGSTVKDQVKRLADNISNPEGPA